MGDAHRYSVELSHGTFLLVQIEQRGVDAVVGVDDPQGRPILRVDSPIGSQGPELVPVFAGAPGEYQIEIQGLEREAGGEYELKLLELRPATAQDKENAKAAVLLSEGDHHRKRWKPENLERAAVLYRQAAELADSPAAASIKVVALRRLSQVQIASGSLEDALDALRGGLAVARVGELPQLEAGTLVAIGRVWRRLGDLDQAFKAFEKAIEVAREGHAPLEEASGWNNLADLLHDRGELGKALAGYDRALNLWRRNRRTQEEATVLHNLGSLYVDVSRLEEARDCLLRSLVLRGPDGKARSRALTLSVLGQVHAWLGEYHESLSNYQEAMALARCIDDRWVQAVLLDRLGVVHSELDDSQVALEFQEKAASIFRELDDSDHLAWSLVNLGWLHQERREPERALIRYREAADLFSLRKDREGEAAVLFGEARALRELGHLEGAREKLEHSLRLIESLRADAPGRTLRRSFFSSRHQYYEDYIDLLMELHESQPEERWNELALETSERTRARSFLDTLGEAQREGRWLEDRQLLRQDRALLDRLDALEAGRIAGLSRADLEARQRDLLLQREVLQTRFREENGKGFQPVPPLPLTLDQMRNQVLDEESLLLIYQLGKMRSFLWVVSEQDLRSFILPGRDQVERLARTAWALLSQEGAATTQANLVLSRLSRVVLGQAAACLQGARLLIVTHGALQYVPFGALPLPGRKEPLLAGNEVVFLDSPSVLAMQRQLLLGRPKAPLRLAVVADPVFELTDPRVDGRAAQAMSVYPDLQRSAEDLGVGGFRRLPATGLEAESLLALVPPGQRLGAVGFAANRKMALSGELSRYRIVHFATHGLIHPNHPELSGLVLSLVNEKGQSQEGFLRVHEFQSLGLSADLVVLSACRTALGEEILGEGMVGMTRGLIEVPRLVVSLWSVEDRSTAELMSRFYVGMLRDRLTPSVALQEAQLSMLRESEWSQPYQWAAFRYQGEWR